jgi:hypothetical protein
MSALLASLREILMKHIERLCVEGWSYSLNPCGAE